MSAAVAGLSRGGAPAGGGGRGRGRGRGGGFGGSSGAGRLINMGAMTMSDVADAAATHGTGRHGGRVPYPDMEAKPEVAPPTPEEARMVDAQLELMRAQRSTPWWLREGGEHDALGEGKGGPSSASAAAAALAAKTAGIKRSAADLPRYSDRQRQRAVEAEMASAGLAATPTSLNDPSIVRMLQREAFPVGLWRLYMQGETRRQERREDAQRRKRDRSWKDVMDRMELGGGGVGSGLNDRLSDLEASGDEDDEADPAADEYEDDEEDDYADNYFDNGEDDDMGDLGGGGGGGEGEADFD